MGRTAVRKIIGALPPGLHPLCAEDTANHATMLHGRFNISSKSPWRAGQEVWNKPSSRFIHFERDAFEWLVSNYLYYLRGGDEPWQVDYLDFKNLKSHRTGYDMHSSRQNEPKKAETLTAVAIFELHPVGRLYTCIPIIYYHAIFFLCLEFIATEPRGREG
jgi:hypothetical protein